MSVPSLEPIEPVLWKIITKHSEKDKKNKILLFEPVALYSFEEEKKLATLGKKTTKNSLPPRMFPAGLILPSKAIAWMYCSII